MGFLVKRSMFARRFEGECIRVSVEDKHLGHSIDVQTFTCTVKASPNTCMCKTPHVKEDGTGSLRVGEWMDGWAQLMD